MDWNVGGSCRTTWDGADTWALHIGCAPASREFFAGVYREAVAGMPDAR
jgi:hypothetical protein